MFYFDNDFVYVGYLEGELKNKKKTAEWFKKFLARIIQIALEDDGKQDDSVKTMFMLTEK